MSLMRRQRQIHNRWDKLNKTKTETERSLQGATSVELFNRTCDDAKEWMMEKLDKIDTDEIGRDMKTVQALQRKHQNLERELAPVEEKFNRVNLLADSVKASYPSERNNVTARQKELQEIWDKVKENAAERRARLDDSMGVQIFQNSAKNLLSWVSDVKQSLNSGEPARDVVTAENLLKKHQDLADEIRAHDDEFADVKDLGRKLMRKNPDSVDIRDSVVQLQEEQQAIHRGLQEKGDWLRQCMDLQVFNREADQIDSITSSHDAFLDFEDLGTTLDDVEALLKRHENFINTLLAQDERIRCFCDMADKLIAARHYDSKYIDERRHQVRARRRAVKEKALHRKELLLASHAYQEFKAQADELAAWIQEKAKTAMDESYRDLTNLERKLQRHEAFEAELKANEERLDVINNTGKELTEEGHYASDKIEAILQQLNSQWKELCAKTEDRGQKLRQAAALHTYNRILEDARAKLDELEVALASDDLGNDLRSVKQLFKRHQALELEVGAWEFKVDKLVSIGQDMAQQGHFDAPNILHATKAVSDRFHTLKAPAAERRLQLGESLKLHQFVFDIDNEMQWIREHLPAASSEDIGQSLIDVQNLFKKHLKLEREIQGHQVAIDKTLAMGQALIDQQHFAAEIVRSKCQELHEAWQNLFLLDAERKKKLELSLKAQQFFSEASELEAWMNEKNDIMKSTEYGKDEDAAVKFLTKHKAVELEIDTYSGLTTEIGHQAQKMIDSNHPDSKVIHNRIQVLQQEMKNLQKLATVRRQKLMESKHRHEYFRESEDLENWINEQMQTATSEDFGHDYEHLLLLQSKFDDFKHRVEAGSERFNQCEELARKLIAADSPFAGEIENRQDHLRKAWSLLLDHIVARDQKLQAASEIHRFNRDVADALSRIQEKYASMSDDLGRDLNSVQSLMRKHEGFENDLVAVEAQLQVLVDDSVRLQAAYPGGNAEHIAEQQAIVLENWNTLQERAVQRKEILQESYHLQRFLAWVRDLETWALGLCSSLRTEEKVRDAPSAQMLKAEHERLKAEIETREESFSAMVQAGEMMIEEGHYSAEEIRERLDQLLHVREQLHTTWQQKKVYLDQLLDLHFFLRDAKQLDTLSAQQEVHLSGSDFGSTVEEVGAVAKKHEAFDKLISTQDEKLVALQEHGMKLLQQNHFDSNTIKQRLDDVTVRRTRLKELSNNRKQLLHDALLHTQFQRDAAEAETWIEEKRKKLEVEAGKGDVTSLEDKMKKLQKHQAFQAELVAHEGNIKAIKKKGELLLSLRHETSPDIHKQLEQLLQQWNQLLLASASRGRGLEEAQDFLEFNNQVEKAEAWIRDKEMMVQAGDTGKDYEHCLALQRKLDDVDSDMRVDDMRVKNINALADKLIRQGRSDTRSVQQRREQLNNKWRALQGALNQYHERLTGSLEIHAFNRDVDDTDDRVNEKAVTLSTEDEGKDLKSVESLQRKQEAVERDMTAIETKLKEHDVEARRLIQKYPDMAASIHMKVSEVQDNWRRLTSLCQSRKQRLASACTLHKFLDDMKELESWVNDMIERMTSGELATNIGESQSMLQLHEERKAEIDGRQEAFKTLKEFGHKLLHQKHSAKEVLEHSLLQLEELRRTLGQAWEERRHMLVQCYDLQIFKEQAEQADSWLASKEAFLNNEDLGDSISSVEALIRKHNNFEKTMSAQSDKIDLLEKFATELTAGLHYDSPTIQVRCQCTCQRRDRLKESAMVRRKRLQESKKLQQFVRNIYEVVGWINEKLQVALDESYRDSTNLLSKIQKHAAYEAELAANKGRVDGVTHEGESLIGAGHFASMEIQTQLQELEALWRQLLDQAALKKERLQDAYQALQFNRMLDDVESWMDDVENQLQSEDHGKDLTSVQNLLKKHQLLETDIYNHTENIEQIKDLAVSFQSSNHFLKDEIEERAQLIINRYQSLHEPVQIRRENLEDALLLQQFYRDAEDELSWISEKEPRAASTDLGTSLTSVQNLQKKHQVLEAEIHTHEPLIATVTSKGRQMIRTDHFATKDVEAKLQELQTRLQQLKDLSSVRRLRLLDAVESQMFYSEVSEAEAWIKEKKPLLTSPDIGKDEDSVQGLMKKLDGLTRDVEGFTNNIAKLAKLSHGLVERGHFDSENIQQKQVEVEKQYQELKQLVEERERRLIESKKFFTFVREADEVGTWIKSHIAVASSEDYGKDVEHVEILIQKFEGFVSTFHASDDRVIAIKNAAKSLINESHSESEKIKAKSAEISWLWEELKECANARQEALVGAKQVHTFDRSADETISWIHEKDTMLSSEDYGHDLESIQALGRHHEGFERDLAAVKEQVGALVEEARRLAALFPDAREHIDVKHEEVAEAWNLLLEKSAQRKDKLQQAEKLQAYFDEYRELMAWINEMMALITSDELSKDVPGAEALLARHKEHKAEIDTRLEAFVRFQETGEAIIAGGHFMADEIKERILRLTNTVNTLLQTWEKRRILYEQNMDTQIFKRDAEQLESWLLSRETVLHDSQYGDSIAAVEELIRKHEDFQKTIEAQEEKFLALNRITLLEEAFKKQKEEEAEQRKADAQRKEQERVETMKRKEQKRILEERRREDERRRTQEIVFKKPGEERPIDDSAQAESVGPEGAEVSTKVPEIRPYGALFRVSSQKSLDGDNKISIVKRVESMRIESLSPRKPDPSAQVKRSESVKLDKRNKKPKRTPSFNTRLHAGSRKPRSTEDLPPVEMEGYLDRKQELQSGGKKATIRSWKSYYTVLCGQLLCFFKDKDAFVDNSAAAPPVNLLQAKCTKAVDYTKKKHVFRLRLVDGAEFLFTAGSDGVMQEWTNKISFHASLPPSMQLLSYDAHRGSGPPGTGPVMLQEGGKSSSTPSLDRQPIRDLNSSTSSQGSSPEQHRPGHVSSHPSGPRHDHLGPRQSYPGESSQIREKNRPTVPPRTVSRPQSEPPSQPKTPDERVSVKSRIQMFQNRGTPSSQAQPTYNSVIGGPDSEQQQRTFTTFTVSGRPNQNGVAGPVSEKLSVEPSADGQHRTSLNSHSSPNADDIAAPAASVPPPLPNAPPPMVQARLHPKMDSEDERALSDGDQEWNGYHHKMGIHEAVQQRQSYPVTEPNAQISRHMSLPPNAIPPSSFSRHSAATLDARNRTTSSEGSSEGEYSTHGTGREYPTKPKDKRSRVFNLFKRK